MSQSAFPAMQRMIQLRHPLGSRTRQPERRNPGMSRRNSAADDGRCWEVGSGRSNTWLPGIRTEWLSGLGLCVTFRSRQPWKIWTESLVTRTHHKVLNVTAGWTYLNLKPCQNQKEHRPESCWKGMWSLCRLPQTQGGCFGTRMKSTSSRWSQAELPERPVSRRRSRTKHERDVEKRVRAQRDTFLVQEDQELPEGGTQGDQENGDGDSWHDRDIIFWRKWPTICGKK